MRRSARISAKTRRLAPIIILVAAFLPSGPLHAQTESEAAAQNMQLATEVCLKGIRDAQSLPQALTAVGFEVTPSADAGVFDFATFGVDGLVDASQPQGYCSIQSVLVPLAMANAIGTAVAERLYPGAATPGAASGPADGPIGPCDGMTFWDVTPILTVSYAQAGNSGECVDDGTSAIIIE